MWSGDQEGGRRGGERMGVGWGSWVGGVCAQGLFLILKAMRWTLDKVGVGGQGLSRRPLRATPTRAIVGSPEARVDPGTSHVTPLPEAPPPDPPAPLPPPPGAVRRAAAVVRPLASLWFLEVSGVLRSGVGRLGAVRAPERAAPTPAGGVRVGALRVARCPAVRGRSWARGLRGADPGGGAAPLGRRPCRFSPPKFVARE